MTINPEAKTHRVEHWFDFICPYCYIAQDRNRILREHGVTLLEHGMQIHPEIGPEGAFAGPRVGASYQFLADQAAEAGLALNWSDKIAYSKPALVAHEWLQTKDPEAAARYEAAVFNAYFAEGRDIGRVDEVNNLITDAGADLDAYHQAHEDAEELYLFAQLAAADRGVQGTPTWIADGHAASGLRPRSWFEQWAAALTAS
ncbi:putative DsbA family dithiol-disulfide isomerase [Nocardioides sp. BE266]|uniref:DsbA family oxidoreductase n=1 Tax=Nocardioides sp. BE266 TaxID=2817725 RepID=UPI0028651AC9|nr:DsbA family protein [Nocardioides sp. BE266]MDR7255007.1 putative DsbA family dithiol-disulfide isomerase [Nocardioides sp. BE266]